MAILLMRHMESEKNINRTFSSISNEECLTTKGEKDCYIIAETIKEFVTKNKLNVKNIYSANSIRARTTASVIAEKLGLSVMAFDELCSNKSGELLGKSEVEANRINPLFIKQLTLFRAGLFSSYDFVKVYRREDKHEFEKKVSTCIEQITLNDKGDLQIFVLHHSSLTAIMINYARKFYNYPSDFYGHVACDLGNVYLINNDEIVLCNEPPEKLLSIEL